MSAARTSARLMRIYPASWRRRYGEELEGLIVEASDGDRIPWRTRLDVALAGGGERLGAFGFGSGSSPRRQVRGSALLVLCAWALFVVGGITVGKFSEHWEAATPQAGQSLPSTAFTVLMVAAACGTVLVLGGVAAAVPGFIAYLRGGGWAGIRRSVGLAALLGLALVAATVGLASWASGLDAHQREGGDVAYGAAFLTWALLICICIAGWTRTAVQIAGRVDSRRGS